MAQLLQAPTDGYEDAIVVPKIAATNFELKHGLINLVQNKQFFGHEKEDPHAHLRYFNKITSTMRQRFDESFSEAWDHFNDLLRACTHHGFSELHQLDTFYNALNVNDHDSLNSTAGGNFLDKMPADCLKIIESKSKTLLSSRIWLEHCYWTRKTNTQLKLHLLLLLQSKLLNRIMLPAVVITRTKTVPRPAETFIKTTSKTPVQPTVTQSESETPVSEPVVAPVSVPMPNLKPSIPYPSRRDNKRRRDQANEQIKKFYEIFKEMSFEISFTNALMVMPKFASTLKALIGNKEKLTDFMVVDFEPDPRVPLILGQCFLKTIRALINVHKGELTLRIRNEAITYNLDQ
nr:reverse transcriptase domain-containing protein [Tanacetum cinerariifolium]